MALAAQPDLSARLRSDGDGLRVRLERREALLELLHGTQATLDPAAIARYLVQWAPAWIPASGWAVIACELGQPPALLAAGNMAPDAERAALAIAVLVASSGEDFYATDL